MNKRKKDVTVYLDDILNSIYKIESYLKGVTKKELFRNEEKQDAIIRRLEMIGEAVKYIDDDFKQKHAGIPWKEMAGMRDVLIHQYFGVDIHIVWETVIHELPTIKWNWKKF